MLRRSIVQKFVPGLNKPFQLGLLSSSEKPKASIVLVWFNSAEEGTSFRRICGELAVVFVD